MTIKYIILLVVCIVLLAGMWYMAKDLDKVAKSRTFVYPGNKHRYYVMYICKLKNPTTRQWHKAVLYRGLEDDELYVRDFDDFKEQFIPIREWQN